MKKYSLFALLVALGVIIISCEKQEPLAENPQANVLQLNSVSVVSPPEYSNAKVAATTGVSVPLPIYGNYTAASDANKWYNTSGSPAHTVYSTFDDTNAYDINLQGDRDQNLPVVSPFAGTVTKLGTTFPGTTSGGNFGSVLIDIGNGNYVGFMHLKNIKVKNGDKVTAGQQVGQVSSTGATNNHLHTAYYTKEGTVLKSKVVSFSDRPFTLSFSLVNGNQLSAAVPFGDGGKLESATYYNNTFWSSDNSKIIKVDGWGKLIPVSKGSTIIRCKFSGQEFALPISNR